MTRRQILGYTIFLIGLLTGITWLVSLYLQPEISTDARQPLFLFFAALLAVLGAVAAFKDTLELVQIFAGREQREEQQQIHPISQTNFYENVDAKVIVTEGENVTLDVTPQQVNDTIVHTNSITQRVELFRISVGEEYIRNSIFMRARFEAYSGIWKILQTVRVAGEALWNLASEENILAFAKALRAATIQTKDDAIFFEKDDYNELENLLKAFGNFHTGKQRLIHLRSSQRLREHHLEDIRMQIERNRNYKDNYEALLDRILDSFRARLAR